MIGAQKSLLDFSRMTGRFHAALRPTDARGAGDEKDLTTDISDIGFDKVRFKSLKLRHTILILSKIMIIQFKISINYNKALL